MGSAFSVEREDPWREVLWEAEYSDDRRKRDPSLDEPPVFFGMSQRLMDRLELEYEEKHSPRETFDDTPVDLNPSKDLDKFLSEIDDDEDEDDRADALEFERQTKEFDDIAKPRPVQHVEEPFPFPQQPVPLHLPAGEDVEGELERLQRELEEIEEREFNQLAKEIESASRQRPQSPPEERAVECVVERQAVTECYAKEKDPLKCAGVVDAYAKCAQSSKQGTLERYKKFLGKD